MSELQPQKVNTTSEVVKISRGVDIDPNLAQGLKAIKVDEKEWPRIMADAPYDPDNVFYAIAHEDQEGVGDGYTFYDRVYTADGKWMGGTYHFKDQEITA